MAQSGFSIGNIVREWSRSAPDAPALTQGRVTVSWSALYERSQRVAGALRAAGVGAGDRVAFLDKNGIAYFEVLFGGSLLGAVNVAVNWRLAASEMAFVINDAEAKVLMVSSDFSGQLTELATELTTVTTIVVVGDDAGAHLGYEAWLSSARPVDPKPPTADDDVAIQLYTSGTTGLPKGVMLTNWNLSGLIEAGTQLEIGRQTVSMVAMPLFHIGGSGWALFGMAAGAHSILVREIDPVAILQLVPEHKITHTFLVPVALLFLTMVPGVEDVDYSSLEVIVYGASPISEDLLVRCLDIFGCGFYQVYGLTETTGTITILTPADHLDLDHRERLRSAGRPMKDVEIRCVDTATGADVEPGAVGEIWIRSAQVMKGYWHKADATREAVDPDGWFKTGDAGYLVDGYLYLHDRVKDMIVSGGENVYPAEVENALMKHEGVADVAVIGVPSERWGEEVKAIVVKAKDHDPDPVELIAFAKARLAAYKVPKSVDFTDSLPRNPSGKILKKDLRAPFWEGKERQIG
ncbi:MAG: long-chain-fatty-acid--CoA ligase [Acidimicrobiales bacterium]